MAFVIKFVKGIRNHWKKSIVAAIAITYGTKYAIESYQIHELMRVYCEQAKQFGDQPLTDNEKPRKVTVILNPNANKRGATKLFDNYCAPILHLAGICVDIVQTQSEGHARSLVEDLKQSDAIAIAGGDGTVSEVITGLMRNSEQLQPVGILPVGKSNTFATKLFPGGNHLATVKKLADATMAIVTETVINANVMQIEVISENGLNKPIYALTGLEWGAYRDAQAKQDKYWWFGSLRNYVTYVFNGYKDNLSWNCTADITYSPPCTGCSNCFKKIENSITNTHKGRWWSSFVTTKTNSLSTKPDYLTRINEECVQKEFKQIETLDMSLFVSESNVEPPHLKLRLGPSNISYQDFITQGWNFEKGENRDTLEVINLRQIVLIPKLNTENNDESWFSIDREEYEVKPVRITLLPKAVKVFCKN